MELLQSDSLRSCCAGRRWLVAALLAGVVSLTLSACSKQPDPAEPRDSGPKAAPQGGDKRASGNGGPKGTSQDTEKAADEKRRLQSVNNLKQIALCLHNFHDVNKKLPPAAICDKNTGKPLLSWRVALLPFMEQDELYRQFKLDEAWDSPHNKRLLEKIPPAYALPGNKSALPLTFYRVFTAAPESAVQTAWKTVPAKGSTFGALGWRLTEILNLDGASDTIGVLEAGEAVPWTKPDPLVYDAKKPLPKLGGLFKDGFHAAMLDASVYFFSDRLDEDSRRALITANGGEPVTVRALEQKGLAKLPRSPRRDDEKVATGEAGPKATATGEKAVEDPRRRQSSNNLKQIMLALHSFRDVYKAFPPAAICDKKTGKPLLSWRVAILPYLEQGTLYKQFKLDEPWDSPHNKRLGEIVVPIYAAPGEIKAGGESLTFYREFLAPLRGQFPQKTAWDMVPNPGAPFGARGIRFQDIQDGTTNTIGVVEAAEAVPWTKPEPLVYDAKKPLPKLGLFKDGFHAGMMDGSVRFFSNRIDEATLRALLTASGGEIIPFDALQKKGLIK
jgi:hypothetical protein